MKLAVVAAVSVAFGALIFVAWQFGAHLRTTSRSQIPVAASSKTASVQPRIVASVEGGRFMKILPGDSCKKIRALYGQESEGDEYTLTWKQPAMDVSVEKLGHCIAGTAMYLVHPGETVMMPNGVVLGKDTILEACEKLKQRIVTCAPAIWQGEGQVHLALAIPPSEDFPFASSFDWSLAQEKADRITSEREPVPEDFTGETAQSYAIEALPPKHQESATP